ncbi:hypothetical protein VTI74DRAFT_6365 [Chaetomium olivicolor]
MTNGKTPLYCSLATQKRKGDIKGAPSCIYADYIEERYTVFICLIYIVEKEDFRVRSKVDERVGMREENYSYVPIWPILYTALEAFFLKLVCKRVDRALALTRVPADFYNTIIDILTYR